MATRSEWADRIREVIDQAKDEGYFVCLGEAYDEWHGRAIRDISIYDKSDSSFGVVIFDEGDEYGD